MHFAAILCIMQRTPPLPGRFDRARFLRLIELVGPEISPTLLAQLVADLDSCDSRLTDAARRTDWALLRETTHDLMALGGSCGALALQDLAQEMNSAAHDQDPAALAGLSPGLAIELSALRDLVRATPATGPVPW